MKSLLYVAIVVLVVGVWIFRPTPTAESTVVVEYRSDTVEVVRVDTVRIIEPRFAESKILDRVVTITLVDTVYRDRVVYLPLEQRRYSDDRYYELWVSGIEPSLDSIRLFSHTQSRTITNRISESRRQWVLYGSLAISSIGGLYSPAIGLQLVTRGRWAYSLSVGSFENAPTYSIGVYYQLWSR